MPMHYPPLPDGTYRYGDPPRPLPSPVPGPDGTQPDTTQPDTTQPDTTQPGPPPPDWRPNSGPPTEDAPRDGRGSGRSAAAAIVGGLALVVVAVLGFALFGPGSDSGRGPDYPLPPQAAQPPERPPGASFSVEGRFTVMSSPGEPVSGDGSGCDMPLTLSDIGEGTRITLSEGVASPIGSTVLAYDGGDLSSCTFTFDFGEVPGGAPIYMIEIPGRGQLPYTEDELRAGVDITLGR
ncbi:hypothetical protein [Dietzia sp. PP-33]|mgnify:CR=1 FL=1|jgi:hypothetical protein|uniref:hypothetical protein n=1 Tax=Dietzia sp. PP-33 TaxID=2957500 RepID=UPI0029A32281|nr:hypothetical protein [Dietzia sp. PP-33]MDX2356232.1 hypothetical protein [Dietzia sp. PP-33]